MSKLYDFLNRVVSKVNDAATKTQLSKLEDKVNAIGTQEELVHKVIAELPTWDGGAY